MQFHFELSPNQSGAPAPPPGSSETADLLRQILDVQREQLAYLHKAAAASDAGARWRAFLARWQEDFPDLSDACRKVLPLLERTYSKLITELTEHLSDSDGDSLDMDFTLQELLDRYGMRLAQLGTLLNVVAPLAESGPQGESA